MVTAGKTRVANKITVKRRSLSEFKRVGLIGYKQNRLHTIYLHILYAFLWFNRKTKYALKSLKVCVYVHSNLEPCTKIYVCGKKLVIKF